MSRKGVYVKRSSINDLTLWYSRKNRKPLVLRGARQVGKSTLVRLFAKELGLQLIEVNLEKYRIKNIGDEIVIESIVDEIESKFDCKLGSSTLLFLDEIQQQPILLSALRYFFEDRFDIPVVAAGSLLEFTLEKAEFSMPVGRIEFFHLGPMTFFEFLMALGKDVLLMQLNKSDGHLNKSQFSQLTELLQKYFFIGGMPEAIRTYIETNSMKEVRHVHSSIMQTYKNDFGKYASRSELKRLDILFERLPSFFGKKVKYSAINPDEETRNVKKSLELFRKARILHFCRHTNGSGLPLLSQVDEMIYKLYFLDIGLLNYALEINWTELGQFDDTAILTKGLIAEQFIAQHLAYRKGVYEEPTLFYWLRDKKLANAEVDFVIEENGKVLPLEVKAGATGRLRSLIQFAQDKHIEKAIRLDLKYRDLRGVEEEVVFADTKFTLVNFHLGLVELLFE